MLEIDTLEFTAAEEKEATLQVYQEWQTFQVPKIIDDRIMELYFDARGEYELISQLMREFEAKQCYIEKCFFFSQANSLNREMILADGGFYNCSRCTVSCVPLTIKNSL